MVTQLAGVGPASRLYSSDFTPEPLGAASSAPVMVATTALRYKPAFAGGSTLLSAMAAVGGAVSIEYTSVRVGDFTPAAFTDTNFRVVVLVLGTAGAGMTIGGSPALNCGLVVVGSVPSVVKKTVAVGSSAFRVTDWAAL